MIEHPLGLITSLDLKMSKDKGESDELEALFKDVTEAINAPAATKKTEERLPVDKSSFPTEMNCSQVFDQLLKCYSIGGQMRNYYRYGEMSYCTDKRNKLKFCLKTKFYQEENRKEAISRWYMERLAHQLKEGKSSEEIWSSRPEPLRRPFREDSEQWIEQLDSGDR